ncbi:ribonuclease E/G [Brotaphodocola sp.]|uniref:ribonuclease E/G n=1 Tax=Brotaphodocola sp. TaxID=3073577 RepID=UPI003D7C773B
MNKMVITRWENHLLTAWFSGKEPVELGIEEKSSILGNIYIGKVSNIIKNLNCAFVNFAPDRIGYYSFYDNPVSLFADGKERSLKCGDEIIVQVAKDAMKTKDPVLSGNLNFTGKYAVLTAGKTLIGFSSKITDRSWKEEIRPQLEEILGCEAGLIVRTNAYGHREELVRETKLLLEQFHQIKKDASYRTCYSLLREAEPEYLKSLRGCPQGTLEEVITDQRDVYETIRQYLELYDPESISKLRFYEDKMVSLTALYSLHSVMDQACQKRVWLKSGGYLIIEYTEAMTVIDVNTGKYSGNKKQAEAIRMVNLEAGKEIARQLRLRNISGMILIDFINMKNPDDKAELLEALRGFVKSDPVKTTVVDMTQLDLVELTRKKEKKPLWEQLHQTERHTQES